MIGEMIDELSDEAIRIYRGGGASSIEEAVDLAVHRLCYGKTCCRIGGLDGFFDDAWNALVGKPQSWYTRISNIQDLINVVMSGVSAIGKDAWNSVAQGTQGPTQDGGVLSSGIDDYDTVMSTLQADMTSIIVTKSNVPTDAQINQASSDQQKYSAQVTAVQNQLPDGGAEAAAAMSSTSASLPPPMNSPSAVGQQTFQDEVAKRASALGQGILDWTKYAAWGIGGLLGLYALSKLSGGRHAA